MLHAMAVNTIEFIYKKIIFSTYDAASGTLVKNLPWLQKSVSSSAHVCKSLTLHSNGLKADYNLPNSITESERGASVLKMQFKWCA